jgi:hypothetical protein
VTLDGQVVPLTCRACCSVFMDEEMGVQISTTAQKRGF